MSDAEPTSRGRHDAELKRQVIAAYAPPDESLDQVSMVAAMYELVANSGHQAPRLLAETIRRYGNYRNALR